MSIKQPNIIYVQRKGQQLVLDAERNIIGVFKKQSDAKCVTYVLNGKDMTDLAYETQERVTINHESIAPQKDVVTRSSTFNSLRFCKIALRRGDTYPTVIAKKLLSCTNMKSFRILVSLQLLVKLHCDYKRNLVKL